MNASVVIIDKYNCYFGKFFQSLSNFLL